MNIKTLCAIALTAASVTAYAGDKPDFKAVDSDADGYISIDEAKNIQGLAEAFAVLDSDKDGKLSEAEYNEVS
ncbi:MAG: hypothetical protein V7752_15205 [Halopseudomonas sp.]